MTTTSEELDLALVPPANEPTVIAVSEIDARITNQAAEAYAVVLTAIGEETMRHRQRLDELAKLALDKQMIYSHSVTELSQKYVTEPGQFEYSPELGAFVGQTAKQENAK